MQKENICIQSTNVKPNSWGTLEPGDVHFCFPVEYRTGHKKMEKNICTDIPNYNRNKFVLFNKKVK
jgi:hypothetical protein